MKLRSNKMQSDLDDVKVSGKELDVKDLVKILNINEDYGLYVNEYPWDNVATIHLLLIPNKKRSNFDVRPMDVFLANTVKNKFRADMVCHNPGGSSQGCLHFHLLWLGETEIRSKQYWAMRMRDFLRTMLKDKQADVDEAVAALVKTKRFVL